MVAVIERKQASFRIDIRDLKTGKIRTFSLSNHNGTTIDKIKQDLILYFRGQK